MTQKSPKKFMLMCLFSFLSRNEAHKLFSGVPKSGVLGGGQQVYVRKFMCFFCPLYSVGDFWGWVLLIKWGRKIPINRKHITFSGGPCGTIIPGTNPHPSQGQTGQNGDFTVELTEKRRFVPGTGPNLSRGGVRLSQGRFPIVPDTVPPKMSKFVGYSLAQLLSARK